MRKRATSVILKSFGGKFSVGPLIPARVTSRRERVRNETSKLRVDGGCGSGVGRRSCKRQSHAAHIFNGISFHPRNTPPRHAAAGWLNNGSWGLARLVNCLDAANAEPPERSYMENNYCTNATRQSKCEGLSPWKYSTILIPFLQKPIIVLSIPNSRELLKSFLMSPISSFKGNLDTAILISGLIMMIQNFI